MEITNICFWFEIKMWMLHNLLWDGMECFLLLFCRYLKATGRNYKVKAHMQTTHTRIHASTTSNVLDLLPAKDADTNDSNETSLINTEFHQDLSRISVLVWLQYIYSKTKKLNCHFLIHTLYQVLYLVKKNSPTMYHSFIITWLKATELTMSDAKTHNWKFQNTAACT